VPKAFAQARADAMRGIDETAALRYMPPWLPREVAETRAVMGVDYWSYRLDGNTAALETLARYSHDQVLARRRFAAPEMFAPETLERVLV
jgi:4,5-dihydroxyphthalate decarboxylase